MAVLGVPTSAGVLTNIFPDCEPYGEGAVLSRFVMADAVPATGKSWFLGEVFHQAAATGLRGIVTWPIRFPAGTAAGSCSPATSDHLPSDQRRLQSDAARNSC